MKHRYPRHLRERYQKKKVDQVVDKLDGKPTTRFGRGLVDNPEINDLILQNQIKLNLMMEMITSYSPIKIGSK